MAKVSGSIPLSSTSNAGAPPTVVMRVTLIHEAAEIVEVFDQFRSEYADTLGHGSVPARDRLDAFG